MYISGMLICNTNTHHAHMSVPLLITSYSVNISPLNPYPLSPLIIFSYDLCPSSFPPISVHCNPHHLTPVPSYPDLNPYLPFPSFPLPLDPLTLFPP
jgi:hypothetical protein